MRICTTGAVLLIAATVPALAHAQGTVSFDAELAKTAATPHVGFKAGGVEWSCTTTRCTGKGSGKDPLGTCKAIVPQVGALKSFTAAGRAVDLHACGAVPAATTMTAAPMSRTAPVSTVKPATGAAAAAAATTPHPAPAAAPSKKGSAPAGGVAWTTSAITLTGTGALATRAPFTPLAWTADPMTLTGTGSAPTRAALGLAFTTDTIRLTGAP